MNHQNKLEIHALHDNNTIYVKVGGSPRQERQTISQLGRTLFGTSETISGSIQVGEFGRQWISENLEHHKHGTLF